jgi:hypothetical protein
MKHGVTERVCTVENFIWEESYTNGHSKFKSGLLGVSVPFTIMCTNIFVVTVSFLIGFVERYVDGEVEPWLICLQIR